MALQKVLLDGKQIAPNAEERLLPSLDVSEWDRLHFHISGGTAPVDNLKVRILFGTPVGDKMLLADSTIWFEDTSWEREFSHTVPASFGGTGFVMSVPVVTPHLHDVILRNVGQVHKEEVYVALFAQEI